MDKTNSARSARGTAEPRQGAQAIRRALAVLRILAAGREDGVPLAEVVIQVLSIEVGARRPLGVSSAGVAILAAMPAQDARKIVAANEKRFEAYRTDVASVLGQVTAARRLGYGMREIGLVQGTKSISTWIKTPDGQPAAAITVSAVRTRLGPRREHEVAEILLREARIIEQAIRVNVG
jgi:DNA-binding IclR family transcriptional regulator